MQGYIPASISSVNMMRLMSLMLSLVFHHWDINTLCIGCCTFIWTLTIYSFFGVSSFGHYQYTCMHSVAFLNWDINNVCIHWCSFIWTLSIYIYAFFGVS